MGRHDDALALDPDGPPALRLIAGSCPPGMRLAILPAAFNPPTRAHVGLANAALATGAFDRLLFALSMRTVNKERSEGASLDERLTMLRLLVQDNERLAAVLWNRGLYVDQAALAHQALAPAALTFVVGFDKILQILDPRYYADRDAALDRLFSLARFLVAPRDGAGRAELDALFARPENRGYRSGVRYLPLLTLDKEAQSLSSTRVRELLARGEDAARALPPRLVEFVGESAAYKRA